MSSVIALSGHILAPDLQRFLHVPFEVPDDARQLLFRIHYNDQISGDPSVTGGNVLDIGVFDANGIDAGGAGFRGWSGSDQLTFVIGEEWSTPPYRAGALPPGTWHLLLSAYKVGPNGLDWSVRIEVDPDPPVEPRSELIAPDPVVLDRVEALPGWYRGDLHAHTIYSDGDADPRQLAELARARGLDFYGITDHNRAQSPHGLVPSGGDWPLLVPGVEVTTYAGHFNVWGTDGWYEFREPNQAGLQDAVNKARVDGGFVSMNHPKPMGPDWAHPEITGFEAIEVWNGWWPRLNNLSLMAWEARLRLGERIVPLGGSDHHKLGEVSTLLNPFAPASLGYPTTWVKPDGPLTLDSLLAALRAGRIFISESPNGPQIDASCNGDRLTGRTRGAAGDALLLIDQRGVSGAHAIASDDDFFAFTIDPTSTYARLQIVRSDGIVRALTNAFWPD